MGTGIIEHLPEEVLQQLIEYSEAFDAWRNSGGDEPVELRERLIERLHALGFKDVKEHNDITWLILYGEP